MVSLVILGISLLISLMALPFWLIESEREKERHAQALEAARIQNARHQEEMAHRAWMMQQQAAEQQRAMQSGHAASGAPQPYQGQQPGPPYRGS